jgi:peptidyl-prolyl cis-trans isomerase A (cyclophilin A)
MDSSWQVCAQRCTITLALLTMLLGLSADPAGAQGICSLGPDNPIVRFETTLGNFELLLCRSNFPETVDNFVQYVDDGAYTDTGFVHRSVKSTPGVVPKDNIDIVQGGGFYVDSGGLVQAVVQRPPIVLEAALPNRAGTIAMARTNLPDTASSQWFINVLDNPTLDPSPQNPGYAVFGEVISGMSVVDAIHAQEIWALNPSVFAQVPLIDFPNDGVASPIDYFVYVTNVSVVPEPGVAAQGVAVLATLALLAARRRRR